MQGITIEVSTDAIQSGLYSKLGGELFLTLISIASFMDEGGKCCPTQQQLAGIMGVTERTANKRINDLLNFKLENGSQIVTRVKLKSNATIWKYSQYQILPNAGLTIKKDDNVIINNNNLPNPPILNSSYKQESYIYPSLINNNCLPESSGIKNAKDVVGYFCLKYEETYGVRYNPNYRRDCSMIKNKLLAQYDGATIEKILDVIFQEYDRRWKSPKFPRPTVGALVTWLTNEALTIIDEREKKAAEEAKAIEEAQSDPRNTKEYIDKLAKLLGE